jgi:hypothetical protein
MPIYFPWRYNVPDRRHDSVGSAGDAPPSHCERIYVPGGYIAIAVGAFLDFAVKASPVILGINFRTLGFILISVGSLSVFLPVISNMTVGLRRQRTIIEDDGGYGLRRGDISPSEVGIDRPNSEP